MKKNLLFLACIVAASTFSSNAELVQRNVVSYNNIVAADNASRHNAMAYDAQNALFTAGIFDTEFEGLEPIAASSYIMKNDELLAPTWKVALQGAATVKTLVSDNNGGVYAVGTLADEVIFGSTDGNTITKEGYKEEGAFVTKQVASFIAHYDSDGKLLAVNTIIPKHDPILDATGMYFPEEGDIFCNIKDVVVADNSIYAAVTYSGSISTTDESVSITSGSYDLWGIGWYQGLKAAAVVAFDNNLNAVSFPATLTSSNIGDGLQTAEQVQSFSLTAGNNSLFVGFIATGLEKFADKNGLYRVFNFDMPDESGYNFGYGVASIDINFGTTTAINTWTSATDEEYIATEINALSVAGDNLIVTGMFQDKLGFDNNVLAVGSDDCFAASLNTSDLSVNWASASGYNEGDKTNNEEIWTGSTVCAEQGFIIGYTATKADHAFTAPLLFAFDKNTGAMSQLSTTNYNFGVASIADGTRMAMAYSVPPITGISFADYDVTSGVKGITNDAAKVSVYPNPATDVLNFSQECNATINALDGKTILSTSGVSNINVSNLNNGIYFVTTEVNGTKTVTKVIKK